jgi:methylenetetrahydrofolate reductase (NADPH)
LTTLIESLSSATPTIWLEVSAPRGINADLLLNRLSTVQGRVGAINLADNALGRVKMSSLIFAHMIKTRLTLPVVLNVSCRDRNRFALKSDLLGAAAIGIDGVVALQGDKLPPDGSAGARPVHDVDTFGLLQMIETLNRGDTGEGKRLLKTLPQLVPGVVGNPNRAQLDRELELLDRKAASGARFVITQPIFDRDTAMRFADRAHRHGLRVILGILPVKRESMATYLKEKIKDLSGTHRHFDRYSGMSEEDARRRSLDDNLALMDALATDVAGFNIMSGGGPSLAIELATEWNRSQRPVAHVK